MIDYGPYILALIVAIPGLLAWLSQRRKDAGDLAQKYQEIADKQVEDNKIMQAQIDELKAERYMDRLYINSLERYIDRLIDVVRSGQDVGEAGPRPTRKEFTESRKEI